VPEFFPYINAEIEYRTVGSYYADDANTINVASYNVMDATIGGDVPVAENFVLRAFIRMNNVANTKFIGSIWINPDRSATGQSAFIEPGLPRMLTASISAQYRW
jgi:outer membrane receptor protein involved in Fe transport